MWPNTKSMYVLIAVEISVMYGHMNYAVKIFKNGVDYLWSPTDLLNSMRTSPSHSMKLIGGGGFFSSIRTTCESTLGGGRKLAFPTFISVSTLANNCVFTDSLYVRMYMLILNPYS